MEKRIILLCLFVVCILKGSTAAGLFNRKKLTVHFDKFMVPCPGTENNSTMKYNNIRIIYNKQNGNMIINYDIDISEDLTNNLKLEIVVNRCKSKEALDTCVKFTSFKSDKVCTMLEQSTEVWSPFTKCVKPDWKCPLKKMLILIDRCKSKEALDSCSKFTTFSTDKLCQMTQTPSEAWSPFTRCLKPPWTCPFKKQVYRCENGTLDMDKFNWYSLDSSYWKLRLSYFTRGDALRKEQLQGCFLIEGNTKRM